MLIQRAARIREFVGTIGSPEMKKAPKYSAL
jgi:hypothetical protein